MTTNANANKIGFSYTQNDLLLFATNSAYPIIVRDQ